jgi:hypothetical protein
MNTVSEIKCRIFLLGLPCSCSMTFGQGLVNFNNRVTTVSPVIDAPVSDVCPRAQYRLSGTNQNYHAALLGGPTNSIPASHLTAGTLQMLASPYTGNARVTFLTGTEAGYVAVGTDAARDSGLPYGAKGMFQMVAWEGSEVTWTAAFNDARNGLIEVGISDLLILSVSTNALDLPAPLIGLQPFVVKGPEGANPYFSLPVPTNQTVAIGATVTMYGFADGFPAPAMQWQFNGIDIAGATTTSLVITNVSVANSGAYQVIASNSCDSATSAAGVLTVINGRLSPQTVGPEGFRMLLTGTTGVVFQVQGSSNLAAWTMLGNFTNQNGSLQITDQTAVGSSKRFYRAVLQ